MENNYPAIYKETNDSIKTLSAELTGPMSSFSDLHTTSVKAGHLTTKMKELIALGISITVRCDGCIAYHIKSALDAGANRQEILETIGVAILMGGGPAVIYGAEAFEALNQFEAEAQEA